MTTSRTWSIVGTPSTTYGIFAIDARSGVVTYTLDNALVAIQELTEGETITQTYTTRVTDEEGVYVDHTVTVTINGTNDNPFVTTSTAIQEENL
jgi:large repetitive protein